MGIRLELRHVAKAASYTIKPPADKPGTVFTNAGASGPITFTLPTPNRAVLGHWYRFLGVANQNIIVAAPVAETLIVRNATTFNSLDISTANEKIGAEIEAKCVELSAGVYRWAAAGIAVSHTYTRTSA